jgi:hypothetical protein
VKLSSVSVGAVIAAMCAANQALAQTPPTHDLVWEREQGAEACPVRADFVAAVHGKVGRDPFQAGTASQIQVRLSRTPEKWRAEVRLLEAGVVRGSQPIEAEGSDCSALFSAVVAVAAVMLDAAPMQRAAADPVSLEEARPEPSRRARPKPAQSPQPPPDHDGARPAEEANEAEWALGFEVVQDVHVMPDKKDVCSPGSSIDCFEENGTYFRGYPLPDHNNRVAGGLLIGAPRLLVIALAPLFPRVSGEVRIGWGFGPDFSGDAEDYRPWHIEIGARYWLGAPSARFRGYVGTGFGIAEFAARFDVSAEDCGPYPVVDDATGECLQNGGPATTKQLDGYQRLGRFYVPVRIGAALSSVGPDALTLGLAANFTFPNRGAVLQPSIGYAVSF